MKVLIVGFGSIAEKHFNAIKTIKPNAEIFALRHSKEFQEHEGVKSLFSWNEVPGDLDFIIISNPTSLHASSILDSIHLEVPLFIEKPVFASLSKSDLIKKEIDQRNIKTYVAFNLRFHPLIEWAKLNLSKLKIYEFSAYAGSYLPEWRPGNDYEKSYSAKPELGGGVHLDLIHEMDYVVHLFGSPTRIQSSIRKVSDLKIDSVDSANYLLDFPEFSGVIQLNYFRKKSRRLLTITHSDGVYELDLIEGIIKNEIGEIIFQSNQKISDTYLSQMKYFIEGLGQKKGFMNGISESVKTLTYTLNK